MHFNLATEKLKSRSVHPAIKTLVASSYEMFNKDMEKIQRQWKFYVVHIDKMVLDGLHGVQIPAGYCVHRERRCLLWV